MLLFAAVIYAIYDHCTELIFILGKSTEIRLYLPFDSKSIRKMINIIKIWFNSTRDTSDLCLCTINRILYNQLFWYLKMNRIKLLLVYYLVMRHVEQTKCRSDSLSTGKMSKMYFLFGGGFAPHTPHRGSAPRPPMLQDWEP